MWWGPPAASPSAGEINKSRYLTIGLTAAEETRWNEFVCQRSNDYNNVVNCCDDNHDRQQPHWPTRVGVLSGLCALLLSLNKRRKCNSMATWYLPNRCWSHMQETMNESKHEAWKNILLPKNGKFPIENSTPGHHSLTSLTLTQNSLSILVGWQVDKINKIMSILRKNAATYDHESWMIMANQRCEGA